ncbi:RteC domain-containing protein [Sinomicrobium sp. M5D2P9]
MVFERILTGFDRELQQVLPLNPDTVKRTHRGIHLCRKTLYRLRQMVGENGLDSEAAEIRFFKEVKVVPLSWLIYFTEAGSLELRKPRADTGQQKQFYKKQLHKAEKFFRKHRDFSYYMEQGHTHRDTEYFTRQAWEHVPFSPGEGYRDPDFSTSHDFLWARVQATQRVVKYLHKGIQQIFPGPFSSPDNSLLPHLEWTASKASLTELIYALYSGKAFNHGQAEIGDITAAFETFFNIRLPQVYKTYAEIRMRKGQRIRFLEELIFRLSKKMDEDDIL